MEPKCHPELKAWSLIRSFLKCIQPWAYVQPSKWASIKLLFPHVYPPSASLFPGYLVYLLPPPFVIFCPRWLHVMYLLLSAFDGATLRKFWVGHNKGKSLNWLLRESQDRSIHITTILWKQSLYFPFWYQKATRMWAGVPVTMAEFVIWGLGNRLVSETAIISLIKIYRRSSLLLH